MVPELGNIALTLALVLSILLAVYPLWGAQKNHDTLMSTARPLAIGLFFFTLVAYLCLTFAFVTDDFSVAYVAQHSNSRLPIYYKVTAVWGGHEGSFLLWVLMLSVWTVAVAIFSRGIPQAMVARVLSVLGMVAIGFYLFMLLTSNPFDSMLPFFPVDGRDLNPLLQDFGMIIHPPMLYMGYVGFSVAFAFAISALISGKMDSTWARWSRPWVIAAWGFLTVGIALGRLGEAFASASGPVRMFPSPRAKVRRVSTASLANVAAGIHAIRNNPSRVLNFTLFYRPVCIDWRANLPDLSFLSKACVDEKEI